MSDISIKSLNGQQYSEMSAYMQLPLCAVVLSNDKCHEYNANGGAMSALSRYSNHITI